MMNPTISSDASNNNDNAKKRKANDDGNSLLVGAEASVQEAMIDMQRRVDLLERKTEVLQDKCSALEEKVRDYKAMFKNQKWKYSARLPSRSDWEHEDNCDDHKNDYDSAKSFQESIKKATIDMRRGTDRGEDNGCIVISHGDNPNHHIDHEDIFMPHWREFADALHQYHHQLDLFDRDAMLFQITNVELTQPVLELLAIALKPNQFQTMKFLNNKANDIAFLAEIISNNPRLKYLEFHSKDLIDYDNDDTDYHLGYDAYDVAKISTAISKHSSLEEINFDRCLCIIGFEWMEVIITGCGAKLSRLVLDDCGIETEGNSFLSEFLATNPCLEWLSLDRNYFDDTDAISIANSLRSNKNLKHLSLARNCIEDVGEEALRKSLFDYSSLNAAAASNHTCQIVIDTFKFKLNDRGGHEGPKCCRGAKIFSAFLYRECSIVQHLDDEFLPEILFPHMLGSLQIYFQHFCANLSSGCEPPSNNYSPLSLVYEVMRGWKMPLLYEYLKKPGNDESTKHVITVNNTGRAAMVMK